MNFGEAHAEALRRIRHAKETAAEVLDLGDLPMVELPAEMKELTKLKVLALGESKPLETSAGIEWRWEWSRRSPSFKSLDPIRGLTSLAELSLHGHWQLTSLDPLRNLTALTCLDLSGCEKLTTLEPLRKLSNLTELVLSSCGRLTDLEQLSDFTSLTKLSLAKCYQLGTVEPLLKLTSLTALNLSSCEQLQTVERLRELPRLAELALSSCGQLTDIEQLREFTALTKLNPALCHRLESLKPLLGLIRLTELSLFGCTGLAAIEIAGLSALRVLSLSQCVKAVAVRLVDLPTLTRLSALSCAGLTTLEFRGVPALNTLRLDRCVQLTSVEPLQQLAGLSELRLSECRRLTTVKPLSSLRTLTSLDLSGCHNFALRDLEPIFASLTKLNLRDATPNDFPSELRNSYEENALSAVRAYFRDLGENPMKDAEVKVYVLGNGRVGKTKLVRRLSGLDYGNPQEITTHGVKLYDHEIRIEGVADSVRLNLWDFGGQDIYHASHSLFLRGPAVFLLLWCPEYENEKKTTTEDGIPLRNRRLPYWFDYLREHAGGRAEGIRSPVLLIQSQCDDMKQERKPECDLPTREEFPRLEMLCVSAKTG